jgi:hypothetical protein
MLKMYLQLRRDLNTMLVIYSWKSPSVLSQRLANVLMKHILFPYTGPWERLHTEQLETTSSGCLKRKRWTNVKQCSELMSWTKTFPKYHIKYHLSANVFNSSNEKGFVGNILKYDDKQLQYN